MYGDPYQAFQLLLIVSSWTMWHSFLLKGGAPVFPWYTLPEYLFVTKNPTIWRLKAALEGCCDKMPHYLKR